MGYILVSLLLNLNRYLLTNSFMTDVPIIWKPIHWFAEQTVNKLRALTNYLIVGLEHNFVCLLGYIWNIPSLHRESNSNGTCVHYTGAVCGKYLYPNNQSEKLRFIDKNFGINGTDELFREYTSILDKIVFKNVNCYNLMKPAVCQYGIPVCYPDASPRDICREDCDYIYSNCGHDLQKVLGAVEFIKSTRKIDIAIVDLPNCEKLKYSYEFPNGFDKTCGYLFEGISKRWSVLTL